MGLSSAAAAAALAAAEAKPSPAKPARFGCDTGEAKESALPAAAAAAKVAPAAVLPAAVLPVAEVVPPRSSAASAAATVEKARAAAAALEAAAAKAAAAAAEVVPPRRATTGPILCTPAASSLAGVVCEPKRASVPAAMPPRSSCALATQAVSYATRKQRAFQPSAPPRAAAMLWLEEVEHQVPARDLLPPTEADEVYSSAHDQAKWDAEWHKKMQQRTSATEQRKVRAEQRQESAAQQLADQYAGARDRAAKLARARRSRADSA